MKKLFLLVYSIASLQLFAQETKVMVDANAKPRAISGTFTGVNVSDGIELFLTQGNETSLTVSVSDDKYAENFKTEVVDGVLKIHYDKGVNWNLNMKRKLKAYLSFKSLEKLSASGGAEVVAVTPLNFDKLEMKFSSGAFFIGKLRSNDLDIKQSSGSEIKLDGSTVKLKVDVSSGAHLKSYDFATDYCDAKASSGASVKISIRKELSARANSGGGIYYKGDASVTDININSGGSVKKEKI